MHKNLLRYLFKIYVPGPLPQIPLFRFTKLPGDSFGCSKEITTIGGQIHVDLIFINKYPEPIFVPATSGRMIEFCGLIPDLKQLKIWLERERLLKLIIEVCLLTSFLSQVIGHLPHWTQDRSLSICHVTETKADSLTESQDTCLVCSSLAQHHSGAVNHAASEFRQQVNLLWGS